MILFRPNRRKIIFEKGVSTTRTATSAKSKYIPCAIAIALFFCGIVAAVLLQKHLPNVSYSNAVEEKTYLAADIQAKCEPPLIDWNMMKLERKTRSHKAAVYTPYDLVVGGGEKYLLSVVSVLQNMGYHVDVLKDPQNPCTEENQLLRLASDLAIRLDSHAITLKSANMLGITPDVR